MHESEKNPWKTLTTNTVYDNPWISVSHREVVTPGGSVGIYGKVHFKNMAIGIIPLDADANTWLVGQYRYPIDRYSWEIPEGGGPLGIDPLASAQRELAEETGLQANRWTPLLETHVSNSVSDEHGQIYLAQELTQGVASPEETEELVVKKVPFSTAVEMVMGGEITDALAMLGIMKVQHLLNIGELRV